jgi:ferric-dicitrate binding protein FerR (iron transport regulator)
VSDPFDWQALQKDVTDVQRPFAEDAELLRIQRARLMLAARGVSRRAPTNRWLRAWPVLAAAALIALAIGFFRHRQDSALSFRTGSAGIAGQLGAALSASGAESLPVRFSDGTLVFLAPAARARVLKASSRGADIALEQGSLSLAVVHHEGGRWQVGAGPFTVLVTGTKFDVGWSGAEQTFTLALHEGSVQVVGPTLGAGGRRVSSGESLRVAVGGPSAPPAPAAATNSANAELGSADVAPSDAAAPAPKNGTPVALGSWRRLALEQHYAEALAAAEADGFDASCRAASASDLVLLGNSARFAGSPARAERAFRFVRARFAGTHEASMASFFLGRIAYDQRGNPGEAAHWFQSYLHEEPAGGLAREAAGRLIEAERARGDSAATLAAAQSYLQKYPSGPHANLARSVLKE